MNNTKNVVSNFLNIYWLRPENAIHRSLDVLQMKNITFRRPSLDIGCGNGVFSFTRFDGRCDSGFDVYTGLEDVSGFYKGKDFYNQKTIVKPRIIKKPRSIIDYGLDWKQNLLNNAEQLNIYKNLVQHNLEKSLPFENASFNTIFSNVFYWITDLRHLLSECHRILKSTGRLIIAVPDKKFQKNMIYSEYLKHGHQWAKYLDRGNHENLQHFHTYAQWKSIFSSTGFKVEYHSSYLSEMFVRWSQVGHWIYTPTMTKMSNLIDREIRNIIKSKLIDNILPMVLSYVNYEMTLKNGTFHLFVLCPKNSK